MSRLMIGDPAPEFELENQEGKTVSLAQFEGNKTVVVYFYPKDETPGCVKEACSFRDQYEDFLEAGAEVIGISADSVNSHKLFTLSRRLPFVLLSDPKNKIRKAYGVANDMLGLIPGRETFVIDKYGKIQFRFASQSKIDQHVNDALRVVRKLNGELE
ncbi:MAG: peroxiredoxin [Bacteroidia bacterium]